MSKQAGSPTTPTETPMADTTKVVALVGAIGTIEEQHRSITTEAFRSLCATMSEHATTLTDLYTQVNSKVNAGKKNAPDITFQAFYNAFATACELVGKHVPDRRATRIMFVYSRQGNSDAMRRKFLNVAALGGEYTISVESYVSFIPNAGDYTATGELTSAAKAERERVASEREADEAVRKAARVARPIGFAWDGLVPTDLKGAKRVAWILQLQQDLAVWADAQAKELTDAQRKAARNSANAEIKRAAKVR